MTDQNLLVFGCAIFFMVVAGLYVAARERFVYTSRGRLEKRPGDPSSSQASAHSEGT